MNGFPEPNSVSKWRIVFYGLLAAAGVAAIGYWQHEPALYVFAIFAGVFVGGFGLVLKSARTFSQIRDESERKKFAEKRKSILLVILQILALPTAIIGCVLIYDLFIATPEHDTATVIGKYVTHGSKGGNQHHLQVRGLRIYEKTVSLRFYNECAIKDTVELSLTPIFKDWHEVALVRNGTIADKTTPSDTYFMAFFAFGSLLPLLLFIQPIRNYFNDVSPRSSKSGIAGIYLVIVIVCEIAAIGISLKFLCVLLGFSNAM